MQVVSCFQDTLYEMTPNSLCSVSKIKKSNSAIPLMQIVSCFQDTLYEMTPNSLLSVFKGTKVILPFNNHTSIDIASYSLTALSGGVSCFSDRLL